MTALVPPEVCARALGRAWPDSIDDQVRCIDEGTRALGLAYCCPPWSTDAEDAALRAEMADGACTAATSHAHTGGADASRGPRLHGFSSCSNTSPADFLESASLKVVATGHHRDPAGPEGFFDHLDAVVAGLAQCPGAPPVLAMVSGPVAWSLRIRPHVDPDILDVASDLACARVHRLAERGVEHVAVAETCAASLETGAADDLVVEAHLPIVRSADHLRIEMLLVPTGPVADAAARYVYERWAGPDGCSDGLAFLPSTAFASTMAVDRCVEHGKVQLASADTVVTAPLAADADPVVVRYAAGLLASLNRESTADRESPA